MGTTDAKTGFRLPWSAERDDSGSPADASVTTEQDGAPVTPEHESESPQMIDADAPAASDLSADPATEPVASVEPVGDPPTEATVADGRDASDAPAQAIADEASETPAASPKPNKFMADLAKAMQAAAQSARTDTLARFVADAKAHIETIHSATATEATELRKQADDDVAAIREWSKAEIARIREEADERIAHRKTTLEQEVEAHAAEIEGRIDLVQQRVGAFEADMATFFDRLLTEQDPTRFAAMAERLPEPPPFDIERPWEPTVGIGVDEASPTEAATADPEAATAADESVQAEATVAETVEVEAADAAWTPDDSASPEASQPATDADATPDADETGSIAWTPGATDYMIGDSDSTIDPLIGSVEDAPDGSTTATDERADADPRLAALGAGFADAEAEAADFTPDAAPVDDDVPLIGDDALAARLSGLVPTAGATTDAQDAAEGATTRLIVTGLVSVASIAGFKRHLSRLAGVTSVGVSSGPDGEFVFAVGHAEGLALDDAIAILPGFGARVTDSREGELTVAAREAEAEG